MEIKTLINNLCELNCVSGREQVCKDSLEMLLLPYYDEVINNVGGSSIFLKKGTLSQNKILLDAHLDQIGMIVTGIRDDGLISFIGLGGLDVRTLHGSDVLLHGKKDIKGIVTSKECYNGGTPAGIELSNLYIYTDMTKEELISAGVGVGTAASLYCEPMEFENDTVVNRSLDNRISIAVIAKAIEKLNDKKLNCDIYFVCSSQEESHGRGAKTAANIVCPDKAIIVDVDFGNTPDVDKNQSSILGKGPSIPISIEIDRKMTKKLISLAKVKEIPCQVVVNPTGTGTNASHFVNSQNGIPTAVIGIPQRNMHTALEVINILDVDYAAQLISEYILSQYEISENV